MLLAFSWFVIGEEFKYTSFYLAVILNLKAGNVKDIKHHLHISNRSELRLKVLKWFSLNSVLAEITTVATVTSFYTFSGQ